MTMTMTRFAPVVGGVVTALAIGLTLGACDLDVPDLNNPGLDTLQDTPDRVTIAKACTGLLIGNRTNIANEFGYVDELGVLGREAYNFDTADPRFVGELLGGTLNKGSPFGGGLWGGPYANIRLANVTLAALGKVPSESLPDEDKNAVRGFIHTIMALDLLQVIITRDTNGAVIDTDKPLGAALGAIVSKQATYEKIASLLDGAVTELDGAGTTFPFLLSSGFSGFDKPATFRKFNRALRARVAAYTGDYGGVLTHLGASFLDDTAMGKFETGVYYSYSTKTGDTTNGLINPNIFAHPSLEKDVKKKTGGDPDDRYAAKVTTAKKAGSVTGTTLMSNLVFTIYGGPDSPVALIKNEDLILLKAEALWFSGMQTQAITELNIVRTGSGGLAPVVGPLTEAQFVTELLYDRRYSLLFEGGHRWIDVRRLNRVMDLPLDEPTHMRNVRFPIPLPECNARPGEPACTLGSL
jgi:hypothetical protein